MQAYFNHYICSHFDLTQYTQSPSNLSIDRLEVETILNFNNESNTLKHKIPCNKNIKPNFGMVYNF